MLLASNKCARPWLASTRVTGVRSHPLPLTGERTLPGIPAENYWFQRHLACYAYVAEHLAALLSQSSKRAPILDAGAGEGYGSDLLASATGRAVLAVELDPGAAGHITTTYPQVTAIRANLVHLPLADATCAASVSLQVIEHLWDIRTYLAELTRTTFGPIALSTPNRWVHSPGLQRGERPVNPFHSREFDPEELRDELQDVDPRREVTVLGLHHGARITDWEASNGPLTSALFSDVDDERQRAEDFAQSLAANDFVINANDDDLALSHDLVAWWQRR